MKKGQRAIGVHVKVYPYSNFALRLHVYPVRGGETNDLCVCVLREEKSIICTAHMYNDDGAVSRHE
jgi:hypothetical protein